MLNYLDATHNTFNIQYCWDAIIYWNDNALRKGKPDIVKSSWMEIGVKLLDAVIKGAQAIAFVIKRFCYEI